MIVSLGSDTQSAPCFAGRPVANVVKISIPERFCTQMTRMKIDQRALDVTVEKMLSPKDFFTEYWAKRPVLVTGAGSDCIGQYDIDDFLNDLIATQAPPYLLISVRDGRRVYASPMTREEVRSEVEAGGVAPMRISRIWHEDRLSSNWIWMRALFGSLCRAVSMIYLGPPRSENVDLFLAGPKSHLGVHYDTSHTFTLQLFGERKWLVEDTVRLENKLAIERDPNFSPNLDLKLVGPTREFTLRPGDALYVPAYCVHGVSGMSWSVSLGLGLRAFNEIDLLARLLETFEHAKYAEYPPIESLPESLGEPHVEAKAELLRRVRALLKQLEMAAAASVLVPLRLPDTLAPLKPERRKVQKRLRAPAN